ncbi:MAG: TrmH family RNA methyltransferase [Candidatus Sulfotelmatobacter sp.]
MPTPAEFDRLRVVLVDARNPLNIGAAARAMSNFGFQHLRVVNPYDVAFEGARSAVGAAEVLARAEKFATVAEAVSDCSLVVGTTAIGHRDLQHSLQRLEAGAPMIRGHLVSSSSVSSPESASGCCALLFGSEKFGLSNKDMSYCHWLMHIPTREEHRSMNLGQAVAICLYELARDPGTAAEPEQGSPASGAELERIHETLLVALRASGYPKLNTSDSFEGAVRRLVWRLRLQTGDAEFLLGMLRQMVWKMGNGSKSGSEKPEKKPKRKSRT